MERVIIIALQVKYVPCFEIRQKKDVYKRQTMGWLKLWEIPTPFIIQLRN